MADLYSVLPGLDPSGQDILEAELLSKQILEAKYPDLDLREGTGIRDLVLRPAAFILALCKKGYDYYFSQNLLGSVDNDTPAEIVDGILGNLFLERNNGTYSVINARLYFARQKNISLTASTSFSTDGSLLFFPAAAVTYPSTALQFDSYQNEWYIDVDLVAAEKGSGYNISAGSLLYFSNFDPFFLHAEINYLNQASLDSESNLEFIDRAKSSISTRNLINVPSIKSRLLAEFNYLSRIVSLGASDPEMFRDMVYIAGKELTSRLSNATTLVDSDARLLVELPNHGFIVGQKINVREQFTGAIVMKGVPVYSIVDANQFKVALYAPIAPRAINKVFITPVWEPTFVHLGGKVDVVCSDAIESNLVQYTLNSNGRIILPGPVYNVTRSAVSGGDLADTCPFVTPYTLTNPNLMSREDVSFSQDINNNLTLTLSEGCPLAVGRLVKVTGWPTLGSTLYLPVREVIDEWSVYIGDTSVTYTVDPGLSPSVTFVIPELDFGFSNKQKLEISFGVEHANQTASFQVDSFQYVESIQPYLDLPDNRVICADYLARGFDIYVVNFNLVVYDNYPITSGEAAIIIENYFKSLQPGEDLIISNVISALTANGVTSLKTPADIDASLYTKDLFPVISFAVTDKIQTINSTCIFKVGDVTITPEILP